MWQVKLVAELQPGVTTETEVARIERTEEATLAELGLRLEEAKQLTAALQAQIVPAQVTVLSECRRSCVACGGVLASQGHYPVRFRSPFGGSMQSRVVHYATAAVVPSSVSIPRQSRGILTRLPPFSQGVPDAPHFLMLSPRWDRTAESAHAAASDIKRTHFEVDPV